MEYWRNGVLEEWSIGPLRGIAVVARPNSNTPTLQHSNPPILQYSNTPILQYSNTPQELQNETAPFPSVDGD